MLCHRIFAGLLAAALMSSPAFAKTDSDTAPPAKVKKAGKPAAKAAPGTPAESRDANSSEAAEAGQVGKPLMRK